MEHLELPAPAGPAHRFLVALALLALLVGAPVRAAAAPADLVAPSFLIEKISVAGNRRPASARIIVAESLLTPGQSYGEDQLRDAVHRIKRLPFIVDADFALQKGSERGQYELVITVEESRPLFLGYDLEGTYTAFSPIPGFPEPSHRQSFESYTGGVREFVGSTGLVFATASKDTYQVGYTRYDLFGPGSFLSAALSTDHGRRSLGPSLSAGFPLTFNQSLRVNASWLHADAGSGQTLNRRAIDVDWLYDSTDDPIFATRGTQANVALGYFYQHAVIPSVVLGADYRSVQHDWGLTFSGLHFWPLSAHQSVSLGLVGEADRATASNNLFLPLDSGAQTTYEGILSLGHSLDLVSGERARRFGDLRLETVAQYQGFHASDALAAISAAPNPAYRWTLRTGLVFRNAWGVVRLGFSYFGKVM